MWSRRPHAAWSMSVDLPVPGSPARSVRLGKTRPPPRTWSSWPRPVRAVVIAWPRAQGRTPGIRARAPSPAGLPTCRMRPASSCGSSLCSSAPTTMVLLFAIVDWCNTVHLPHQLVVQLLDQLLRPPAEPRGHLDVDNHDEIAATPATRVRHAETFQTHGRSWM